MSPFFIIQVSWSQTAVLHGRLNQSLSWLLYLLWWWIEGLNSCIVAQLKKNTKTKKRKEADVVTPRYVDDELQKTLAFKCAVEVVRVRFSQCTFILVYKLSFTMNKTSKLHMHRLLVRGKRQKQRETKLIVAATNNILVRNKLLRMDFTRKRVVDGLY